MMFSATLRATPPKDRSDITGLDVANRTGACARYFRSTAAPPMQMTLLAATLIVPRPLPMFVSLLHSLNGTSKLQSLPTQPGPQRLRGAATCHTGPKDIDL